MSLKIVRYSADYEKIWNKFVKKSKNSTFMFDRNFMEYHAQRFKDFSLLIFSNGELKALLPAHEQDGDIFSHGGLSYSALIIGHEEHLREVLQYFEAIFEFYKKQGFRKFFYKKIPSFYCSTLAQEDEYALFLAKAQLISREVNAVVELDKELKISQLRKRSIRKALLNRLEVGQSQDYAVFWEQILSPNLWDRHQKKPVHTLAEIQMLAQKFPENIKLFVCQRDGELLAGTLLFENLNVVHCQYIGSNEKGRLLGASDLLFYELLSVYYPNYKYFSFGISTEQKGRYLNRGLHYWKESWGAKSFMHDSYEVCL